MELGLKGKNVVVTGGGNNIGRAITLAFAAEGCNVAIAELNRDAGQAGRRRSGGPGKRRYGHGDRRRRYRPGEDRRHDR